MVCAAAIRFYDGLGELVWAGIIGGLVMTHVFVWTIGGDIGQLRWLRGVWGERQTEHELSKLGIEWQVVHDVPRTWGNWDHIAVSRAGVFAVETKWTSATAVVADDELRLGRIPYAGRSFRGAAAELSEILGTSAGRPPWVNSVVVIWGDFDQQIVDGERVTFVSGRQLNDWLCDQPTRLSEDRARVLANAVRVLAASGEQTGRGGFLARG
jgi:hypothetical protein